FNSLFGGGLSKQQYLCAGARNLKSLFDEATRTGSKDYSVGATATGCRADCHGELRIAWMERFGTKPECQLAPQVNGIGRHHLCTSAFRQQRKDQPYGSLSQHCHDVARPQLQQLDPLEASINRFYPPCLIERNTIGNALNAALHNPIHHANILRESTAGRLISGRNTYPLINGALRIETPLTIKTVAARYMVKNYYAITRCVLVHA